jgi:LuxR family quorum sensing-dependent transcriptional regulator
MTAADERPQRAAPVAKALKLVRHLERAEREELLRCSFQHFVESIGFSSFTCAKIASSRELDASRILTTTRPAGFLETYLARGYSKHDPMLREVVVSQRPVQWSEVARRRSLTRAERDVLRHAARFGLEDGFAVPVRDAGGFIGLINIAGPPVDLDEETRALLILVAPYVYQRLCGLKDAARRSPGLTAREAEVLSWIAEGKSDWQIGKILGISRKTVNYHIENVKRKFGVASRIQALMAALASAAFAPGAGGGSSRSQGSQRHTTRPRPKSGRARRRAAKRASASQAMEGD